jgi:hypothetical protein
MRLFHAIYENLHHAGINVAPARICHCQPSLYLIDVLVGQDAAAGRYCRRSFLVFQAQKTLAMPTLSLAGRTPSPPLIGCSM